MNVATKIGNIFAEISIVLIKIIISIILLCIIHGSDLTAQAAPLDPLLLGLRISEIMFTNHSSNVLTELTIYLKYIEWPNTKQRAIEV